MNITAPCEGVGLGLIPGETTTLRARDVSGSILGSYPSCRGSSPRGRKVNVILLIMSNNREQMRSYMKRRYHRRRSEVIAELGGKCTRCGSKSKLEIDHIDPAEKRLNMSLLAGMSEKKLRSELPKCQVLCRKCHMQKSILDMGHKPARGTHGTLSSHRYCRCLLCRAAYNSWQRRRRKILSPES